MVQASQPIRKDTTSLAIADCPRCLFTQLLEALKMYVAIAERKQGISRPLTHDLIKRAESADLDLIPHDEVPEAAANQGHRYG